MVFCAARHERKHATNEVSDVRAKWRVKIGAKKGAVERKRDAHVCANFSVQIKRTSQRRSCAIWTRYKRRAARVANKVCDEQSPACEWNERTGEPTRARSETKRLRRHGGE